MSNFIYMAGNELDGATITVSTEDATYVKANLYNQRVGKPFKFTGASGNIVVDLGSATSITGMAVLGHNIDAGATVTLEYNNADAWGAPAGSEAITIASPNMYKTFTAHNYRYWRLVVSGAAATVKIGEFVLKSYTELSQNFNWGYRVEDYYGNIRHETEYGQVWAYNLFNRKTFEISFMVNDTTHDELVALIAAVEGGANPFVFIDPQETTAHYVRMSDALSRARRHTNWNEATIVLTEEPLGKDI